MGRDLYTLYVHYLSGYSTIYDCHRLPNGEVSIVMKDKSGNLTSLVLEPRK